MAASLLGSLLRTFRQAVPLSSSGQARGYYVDWRMLRDVKRRKMAYEYADERLRINSLRKNTILPKDLQVSRLSPFTESLTVLICFHAVLLQLLKCNF
ncbi:mitochondrial ribosomal protein S14 (predicted), isoform CRA_c [Rattus norvegicus]|uniref:Mitochondrial ribosomal protein S14 (Predicted), isoform CRA_c n=1 Tax=Rattus norvegicus TaxID=10116 RepID=A6ID56_RAT|nr:mitochondrial ribosomal protein S14 (predicted), isoform CRA_c [Rattus norvegicus]